MTNCPYCHAPLPEVALFCVDCGRQMHLATVREMAKQPVPELPGLADDHPDLLEATVPDQSALLLPPTEPPEAVPLARHRDPPSTASDPDPTVASAAILETQGLGDLGDPTLTAEQSSLSDPEPSGSSEWSGIDPHLETVTGSAALTMPSPSEPDSRLPDASSEGSSSDLGSIETQMLDGQSLRPPSDPRAMGALSREFQSPGRRSRPASLNLRGPPPASQPTPSTENGASEDNPPSVGEVVEGYRVVAEIGQGGMGRVYRARHEITGQEVALKMLLRRREEDRTHRTRFINEAKVLATLEHPNLVPLLGYVELDQGMFIIMPFVRGVTLERMLQRQGRLSPGTAMEVFSQICDAISHVHAHNVMHRDLKPSNVMVRDDGRVLVTDFGIARPVGSDQLTLTGMVVGTAEYVAPEQACGSSRDDLRSDIYALGVLIYEMVTGHVPFRHPSPAEVLRRHVAFPPPPPRVVAPHVSQELEDAILMSLEKSPEDRYQTVDALKQAVLDSREPAGEITERVRASGDRPKTHRLGNDPRHGRASVSSAGREPRSEIRRSRLKVPLIITALLLLAAGAWFAIDRFL